MRPAVPLDVLVAASPDPRAASAALDSLAGRAGALAQDQALGAAVVAVAAASPVLARLLAEDDAALGVLAALERPLPLDDSSPHGLARTYRLALLRCAALELTGRADLDGTVDTLSELAGAALGAALRLAEGDGLAVIGMGKLGGHELNYLSDIDVVLVGEGDPEKLDRAARRLLAIAGRCARIDTTLRPEGRDGALVRSIEAYDAYWSRWARPWEFQALLKSRPVAGSRPLGAAFAAAAAQATWSRGFGPDDLHELRRLKERAEASAMRRGVAERDVKLGRGGLRDIEFSVQLLQLVHGAADPSIRGGGTRLALRQLAAGGYVDAAEAATLDEAYVMLRRVEHAVQLGAGRRTHLVPEHEDERRLLARRLGYRGDHRYDDLAHFDRDLALHRLGVRRVHETWYFRPLLDSFRGAAVGGRDISDERLHAFGFADAERTRRAVRELTQGLTRSSNLMRQLLPLLLDWLSATPDPDRGLLGLRRLVGSTRRAERLAATFRDSAAAAQALCRLLGTTAEAVETLELDPELVARLDDPRRLQTLERDALVASAARAVSWREGAPAAQGALRRWWRRHRFGIVARDVLGHAGPGEVGTDLSRLAEAVLETALRSLDPQVPLAVMGLGRFGGGELSYASDLDVVVVFDGGQGDDRAASAVVAEAERVAGGLLRMVSGATPASRIVELDMDLRPEGRQGPLARSLGSYDRYLRRWAQVWERLALVPARPVAGDMAVGAAFLDLVDEHVWRVELRPDDERELRRVKARMERERIPAGEDPRFHLKLGPGALADVELTVQLLQWRTGLRGRSVHAALDELVAVVAVEPEEAGALSASATFCERVRNRRTLVNGAGDALPVAPDAVGALARSLDTTPAQLRDDYLRVTRRARRVVERRFYGTG